MNLKRLNIGCLALVLVLVVAPITALIVAWRINYGIERSGKCTALGRPLTDHEFLEAAMKNSSMRRWAGEQSLQSIIAANPERCCFVVRDKSELYNEDRKILGTYVIEVEIRFTQHSQEYGLYPNRPYKSAILFADRCGQIGDAFLQQSSDKSSLTVPY